MRFLQFPPKTTDALQPLDVGVLRQYKQLLKRVVNEAKLQGAAEEIASRAGIVNLQSLVYNQLCSPAYESIFRHAWHGLDMSYDKKQPFYPILNVNAIQFSKPGHRCHIDGCTDHGFIRCSYCGKLLCLMHFLQQECFHERSDFNITDHKLLYSKANDYEEDFEDLFGADDQENVRSDEDTCDID